MLTCCEPFEWIFCRFTYSPLTSSFRKKVPSEVHSEILCTEVHFRKYLVFKNTQL